MVKLSSAVSTNCKNKCKTGFKKIKPLLIKGLKRLEAGGSEAVEKVFSMQKISFCKPT
jgi:hypothetical protein